MKTIAGHREPIGTSRSLKAIQQTTFRILEQSLLAHRTLNNIRGCRHHHTTLIIHIGEHLKIRDLMQGKSATDLMGRAETLVSPASIPFWWIFCERSRIFGRDLVNRSELQSRAGSVRSFFLLCFKTTAF